MNTRQYVNKEKALIFRITHLENIPWILNNGLRCQNSDNLDPKYIRIGSPDLIKKRASRSVPIPPGGCLNDYISFYFTPLSIMLYNITTGHGDIRQWDRRGIVIFVSSLSRQNNLNIPFVFTDGHAYRRTTQFFNELSNVDTIDWEILQNRDFKNDPDRDPDKKRRYQAEALAWKSLPIKALLGIICFDQMTTEQIQQKALTRHPTLKTICNPTWYF